MHFALTTRWNAGRHETGEAMIEEILALGFDRVELGYDLRGHLVPGTQAMIRSGRIKVDSLHAFCPLPAVVPHAHPEPFTLADPDPAVRATAVHYLENTIRFAGEVGARVVVAHAGNADMRPLSPKLIEMALAGRRYDDDYEKLRMKVIMAREKAAAGQIPHLYAGIERLLPLLTSTRCALALEILPSWEALPSETEMERLAAHFDSPWVRCWHDIGHGQIRENLGFTSHLRWVRRLRPWLAGFHIHDVEPPVMDHLMPPLGAIDFKSFREVAQDDIVRVLEPRPAAKPEEIVAGRKVLEKAWGPAEQENS
jgi:sugar phosphate isomerase/epimerase